MARETLQEASATLRAAVDDATDDVAEGIEAQADRVSDLADREFDPDHGTLARLETKLGDLREEASEEAAERIETALEQIREFRSTVEGV